MSKTRSHGSQYFDCSAYLRHRLQWPAKEIHKACDSTRPSTGLQNTRVCNTQYFKNKTESAKVQDWSVLLQKQMREVNQRGKATSLQKDISPSFGKEKTVKKFMEKQLFYESEYNTLMKWMGEKEIIVPPPSMFADKLEEIQRISSVADEALDYQSSDSNLRYNRPAHGNMVKDRQVHRYMGDDLENEVAHKAIEAPRTLGVISPAGFQNFVKEQLVGFGESYSKKDSGLKKLRLCRHFVKGFCLHGDSCEF